MGLDMYLNAKRYIWNHREDDQELQAKLNEAMADELEDADLRVKEVSVEAMYWRKANAIHKWFVENCQEGVDDCREYYVVREQLQKLKELCELALEHKHKANEYLPTQGGFFFGSTDYDDWFFEELRQTADGLKKVLSLNDDWDFYYRSSW